MKYTKEDLNIDIDWLIGQGVGHDEAVTFIFSLLNEGNHLTPSKIINLALAAGGGEECEYCYKGDRRNRPKQA